MGKLMDRLQKQLKTKDKEAAEDCILIYNKLEEMSNGYVWSSQWAPLTTVEFEGWHGRIYTPSSIGYTFLDGLKQTGRQ